MISLFNQLLSLYPEHEVVEFKEAKIQYDKDKLGKYFSALSNEASLKGKPKAWLIFGVKNDRSVIGTNINDKQIKDYRAEVAYHTSPSLSFEDVHRVDYNGLQVLLFEIPAASQGMPVYWKGHLYNRDGDSVYIEDPNIELKTNAHLKNNNVSPSSTDLLDIIEEEQEGKSIVKIIVANGSESHLEKEYSIAEKGCLLRIETSSESIPQKVITDLSASRTSIRKIKAHRQDLNFEQLSIYYQERGKPLNENFKHNLELLTEEGALNYSAYLLADSNNISIKVAKYKGLNRTELIENNEYGYCSIIKATKRVLDKLEVENTTFTSITTKERVEQKLWNSVALREAIINAFVHNDYTRKITPKFEIFDDRIEITSAGALPEGLSKEDVFEGVSIPRNMELMRIYKDLGLVEELGKGVPSILQKYGKECFKLMDNFTRITLPLTQPTYATNYIDWQNIVEEFIGIKNSASYKQILRSSHRNYKKNLE